jgi:hypothetical protein
LTVYAPRRGFHAGEWQSMIMNCVRWLAGPALACLGLGCGDIVAGADASAPSQVGHDAGYGRNATDSSSCRTADCGIAEDDSPSTPFDSGNAMMAPGSSTLFDSGDAMMDADSSTPFDSGDAIATGTDRGPCGAGNACPPGSSCLYPIVAGCAATGECLENPSPGGPFCESVFSLCACDGGVAVEECFTSGYATAPVSDSCGADD